MCSTTIRSSFYEAKRKLRDLGLGYETIHACKYDCVLYWKEFVDLQHCPTCGEARYKEGSAGMRWHRDKRVETDDVLRHPANAEGWIHFDFEYPDFASDPRNVRLDLALDGFNPFGQMSTLYSMWPVVLLPYNFPPWKCMKETNFFMSLLIPGPKSLGRKIDVYLQPLIEELTELWTFGVPTYDSLIGQFFQQYATLLWMINDFPTYGDLLRWSTKRYQACPICMGDRSSFEIRGRISFMGHRHYLQENHIWRKSRLHDGKVERGAPLVVMNGHEILEQLDQLEYSVMKVYVMNESNTFCSRYLSGIETQFIRDERNDDTIVEDKVIGDFEIFKQKVRPLGASSVRAISQKEKRLFHWYILNNVEEISEYRKKHLRLKRRHAQNSMDLYKRHERAFSEWFRVEVLELHKSVNLSGDFFSLAMGPSFDVRCYNGFIVGSLRFVEHQMLTTFKEFRAHCYRDFKKYNDLEKARANPPNVLVGRHKDWQFLYDHYMSRAFQEQSRMNKAAKQKQPYNHRSGPSSFYNEKLNPGTPVPEPLSEDKICDQVLGRRPGYSKCLCWGPKPKACKTMSASSSTTSCSQSIIERQIQIKAKLDQALEWVELQDRNYQALASEMKQMRKLIENMTRAQEGPPHDP
ncbi:uncharacterized protein E5676_scaffold534G00180 [Cucumis melo var. makuwa]|uniref:CACTA en-spm transposon protein n=1 Tax=Cucumis melo var. makuwa TaxID=1194695 RepID=A0A5D3C9V0_CUCMM|nr:uncharacterized protein E6C27_scaffold540G00210 [Cucumis melo var. makuwa]TYK08767.1 uncharacterized protein E5676_scaffold534G00180 [Cucumis melo var. makuwa]